jgi:VanZ family protein
MSQSIFRPWWTAAAGLSLVGVLALTHIPGPDVPEVLQAGGLDKLEHIAAYGLIASFFLLSLKRPARPALLLLGLAALAGIGALDETTQPLVQRTASLTDYACDLAGIAVACLLFGAAKRSGSRTAPR